MTGLIILALLIAAAVFLLKQFDKIAGRGPKQVSDGIRAARVDERTGSASVADELSKLAALRDSSALSQDEFEAQKRRLLS
jgi:hypothetical protein